MRVSDGIMKMALFLNMLASQAVLGVLAASGSSSSSSSIPGAASYTVPAAFPTSVFSSYYSEFLIHI